jgi:hypothetical protein
MEDGNGRLCRSGGRTGTWVAFSDGTGKLSHPIGPLTATSLIPGCRDRSARALHVAGQGFQDWGAGIAAKLSETAGELSDWRDTKGIRFWARSASELRLRVSVATRATLDATYGGACSAPPGKVCNDHFAAMRAIHRDWAQYTVRFESLRQEGWGVSADFDLSQVMELHFTMPRGEKQTELDFDLWLDDVALFSEPG